MSGEYNENNGINEQPPVYGAPEEESSGVPEQSGGAAPAYGNSGVPEQSYGAAPAYGNSGAPGQPYGAVPPYGNSGAPGQPYGAVPPYGNSREPGLPYMTMPYHGNYGAPRQPYGTVPPYGNPQGYYRNVEKPDKTAFGIASMVLGIVSLLLFVTCVNYVLAIVAIVFGIIQLAKYKSKGMAVTGIVTAVLSMILNVAVITMIILAPDGTEEENRHESTGPYDYSDEFYDEWFDENLYDFFKDYDGDFKDDLELWENGGGIDEL